MSDFKIQDKSDGFVCATWESAIIYRFTGMLTKESLLRIDAVHDRLAALYPVTLGVAMSAANQKLPDAETRALSSQLIAKRPPEAVISAVILEGGGVWAAGARALVATMFLMSGSKRQNKVFALPEEACAWGAPLMQLSSAKLLAHTLAIQSFKG